MCDCLAIALEVHDRAASPTESVRVEMCTRLREEIEKQEVSEYFMVGFGSRPQISRLVSMASRMWQALTSWFYDFFLVTPVALALKTGSFAGGEFSARFP